MPTYRMAVLPTDTRELAKLPRRLLYQIRDAHLLVAAIKVAHRRQVYRHQR